MFTSNFQVYFIISINSLSLAKVLYDKIELNDNVNKNILYFVWRCSG